MPTDEQLERLREHVARFPKAPGVYLMKDAEGRVLYVGKAKDLRARVSSYFQPSSDLLATRGPEIAHMATLVHEVDFLECESEVEAMLREARLIKDIQPLYNDRLKDDKTFPYLEITLRDDFPGVYVTRRPRLEGSKLYGPFTSAQGVRDAVNALQKIFKFRTCELDIRVDDDKRRFFRPCLLHAINQCTAPCADLISKEAYREDIRRLRKFLGSKRSLVLRRMKADMEAASKELRFEDAAKLRDQIRAIESLALSGDVDTHVQPEVFFVDPTAGLDAIAELLGLESRPRSMECIDISHIQGEATVGSLVCFIDGRPFKPGYKRYRIGTVAGIDDYAAIREVVTRRYRHAAEGDELYPDIIVIDGGLGQLHAALEAFEPMNIRPPMVISLAKREEEIYVQRRAAAVRLERNDPALRVLQHIRDEAHRFAQHYHHVLRAKKTFDEDVRLGKRPPSRRRRGPIEPDRKED